MESFFIHLDDVDLLDHLVHTSAQQASDIHVVTKPRGTVEGNPVVVIAFDAMIDGKRCAVQATTTVRLFQQAAAAMRGRYGDV